MDTSTAPEPRTAEQIPTLLMPLRQIGQLFVPPVEPYALSRWTTVSVSSRIPDLVTMVRIVTALGLTEAGDAGAALQQIADAVRERHPREPREEQVKRWCRWFRTRLNDYARAHGYGEQESDVAAT